MATQDNGIDESKLSEQELAALKDEDTGDSDELDAIIGDDAGDDDDVDDELDDAGEGAGDDDTAGDADDADDAAAAGASDDTDDAEDGVVSEFVPQSNVQPVENYDQRMQEFAGKKADLRRQLSDGDIDIEHYESAKDAIVEQETELKLAQRDYENSVRREQQTAQQKWEWEQEQFFESEANKVYKDTGLRGTAMNAALNKKVIELANDPVNAKRSGTWFLQEADRQVREAMNLGKPEAAEDKGGKGGKGGKGDKGDRKPDLTSIPKTLGNLPAAEQVETGGGEFAYLDKLEGVALEQALATISRDPAKEARYLRQA